MANELDLKYDDYIVWYESARKNYLEPALATAVRLVAELLDTKVDSIDRGRFRISTSRVKSAQRSFAKLRSPKYRPQVNAYASVPDIIDDLVGLRLVCNNLSDISTLQVIFGELPLEDEAATSLAVEKDSQRDYFRDPKESGYRAYHLNLVVPVPQMEGSRRVRVEIQARTLLQDGWGELTHEDTYKPGSTVPEWIVSMSLRMSELLAAVDNIAQDLRIGLDVEAQRSLETASDAASADLAHISAGSADVVIAIPGQRQAPVSAPDSTDLAESPNRVADSEIESAVLQESQRLIRHLTGPTALAAIAQQLSVTFGTDIKRIWERHGGFKRFIEAAAPDSFLSGPAPGYIHPPNTPIPENWTTEDTGTGSIPDLIRELRTYEKAIPLVSADRLDDIIKSVVSTLKISAPDTRGGRASSGQIDTLARLARTEAETRRSLVVRNHAVYVLQALNRIDMIRSDIDEEDVRVALFNRIASLAISNSLISSRETATQDLTPWLRLNSPD